MNRRRLLRGLIAGAMAGLLQAAGLDRARPAIRRPLRVVWLDDRTPADPLAGTGVWFLVPLDDPRPGPADLRRLPRPRLRLDRLAPRRLVRFGN